MAYKKFIGLIGCGYWGKNLARDFNYLGVLRRVSDSNNDAKNEVKTASDEAKFESVKFFMSSACCFSSDLFSNISFKPFSRDINV